MLRSTKEEKGEVRQYFELQAPDLQIAFMQKVYSEAVLSTRRDVWDIDTDRGRWWVITDPSNLYSQEQFPSMDLAMTFHIGLCLRVRRTEKQRVEDKRVVPFDKALAKLGDASDALSNAHTLSDYNAVGVRVREALLEFVSAAQDAAEWTSNPPKRADFRGWSEIIANEILPGESNKERRGLLKSSQDSAWTFSNWLTHAKSATWMDAEIAVSAADYAVGLATSLLVRQLRGVPSECPDCGSPRLEPQDGENTATPGILWQRPLCLDCGWAGRPMPIMSAELLRLHALANVLKRREHTVNSRAGPRAAESRRPFRFSMTVLTIPTDDSSYRP